MCYVFVPIGIREVGEGPAQWTAAHEKPFQAEAEEDQRQGCRGFHKASLGGVSSFIDVQG